MPEFFVWPLAFSIPLLIWTISATLERRRARKHLKRISHLFEGALLSEEAVLTASLGGGVVTGENYGRRTAVKVAGGRWLPDGARMSPALPGEPPGIESSAWSTEGAELFWAGLGAPPKVLEDVGAMFTLRPDGWVVIAPVESADTAIEVTIAWTRRAAELTAGGPEAWIAASLNRLARRDSPTTAAYLLHRLWAPAANDDRLREKVERTLTEACAVSPADSWTVVARTVWTDLKAANA